MRRFTAFAGCLVLGLQVGAVAARAQEEQPSPAPKYNSGFQIGLRAVGGNRDSGKFNEYRDLDPGAFGNFWLHDISKDGTRHFDADGFNVARRDQAFHFDYGHYNEFEISLFYNQIPHVFSVAALTPYAYTSRNVLVLPDNVQSFIQGAPNNTVRSTRLGQFLRTSSFPVPLQFDSDYGGIETKFRPKKNWEVSSSYTNIKRDGNRAISLGFGSPGGNFANIAAPVDDEMQNLRTGVEHFGKGWNVRADYFGSLYSNSINSITVDNPIRLTDASGNPGRGLLSQAPNNEAHTISLSGGSKLDLGFPARVAGTASWSHRTQNDPFLPATINTAIASPLFSLGTNSLNADVDTFLANLVFTGRPTKDLSYVARYRMYDMDNQTPELSGAAHPVNDSSVSSGVFFTSSYDYQRQNADFDLTWRINKNLSWRTGYGWERWDRPELLREVATTKEDIIRTSLDYRPNDLWTLRSSFQHGDKTGTTYNTFAALLHQEHVDTETDAGVLSTFQSVLLRKFDQANRRQDKAKLMADYTPNDKLCLSFNGTFAHNDYQDSPIGLQADERFSLGTDASYRVNDRLNLTSWYTYETIRDRQVQRYRPTANGLAVDSPLNDFFSSHHDIVNTLGGSASYVIKPNKDEATLSFVRQGARANTLASGVPGFAPSTLTNDGGAASNYPELSDTLDILDLVVKHHLRSDLSLVGQYRYEHYSQSNFQFDNLQPFMPNSTINTSGVVTADSRDVFLGDQIGKYDIHLVALSAVQRF